MCGIAGVIGRVDSGLLNAARAMHEAHKHRGPDDEGFWSSTGEGAGEFGAAFAFRRLAIIDLSPDAHQPMTDPATGNVIIFNGEIYNYRILRRELEQLGERFTSLSDTEVLLKAYGRWSIDAVRRLRGMFAFAIWDARRQSIVLARDRVGIKPLYLATIDRPDGRIAIAFASELRSLLASGLVPRRIDPEALSTYIWNGFVVGPDTIIEGVRLLPAGTVATICPKTGVCELARYWQIPDDVRTTTDVEGLRGALHTAMEQHLMSDVPLGVFLSGGVDSSAVSALAVRSAGSSVRTFNISFDEAEFDESRFAKAVAQRLGTNHTDVRLAQRHFHAQLSDALASIDQPTFDAINTYFVSRAVCEAGITVALAGTGGDELFGGYRSFVDIPKAAAAARRLQWMPEPALRGLASATARVKSGRFGEVAPQTRWGKLGDGLATRGRLIDLYQVAYGLFTEQFANQLLEGGLHEATDMGLPQTRAAELRDLAGDEPTLHAISMLELSAFIGERLLRDTDAASMAVSLEARVPLLDHEVIEAVAHLESTRRFHPLGRKQLLRELAMPELEPSMFDRPKAGFELPIGRWCREQLKGEVESTLSDRALCASIGLNADAVGMLWRSFQAGAPGIYWSRVWAVFVLLWWCRTHKVTL